MKKNKSVKLEDADPEDLMVEDKDEKMNSNLNLNVQSNLQISAPLNEKVETKTTNKNSKKKIKGENLNSSSQQNNKPEDDSFIEYILMDFRNFENLNKFKNMKSLSLINQGITSIEVINQILYIKIF